jgi:hypothetical protein
MLSDAKKVDILWKKLFYVASDTDPINKDGMNETTDSGIILLGQQVWADSNKIPRVPPPESFGAVGVLTGTKAVTLKRDTTVVGNRGWYVVDSLGSRITNWIPPSMGQDYLVRLYLDSPTTGQKLNPLATNYEWIFDYSSGTLTFVNCVPPRVLSMTDTSLEKIYLEGYTYTGNIGGLVGINNTEYEISGTVFGPAIQNDLLMRFICATPITFPKNLIASQARCKARPLSFVNFGLYKNGIQFGVMIFAPAINFGSFRSNEVLFNPGDELDIFATDVSGDPTFGNCGWTLVAKQTV